MKPVSESLAGPLTNIINSFIKIMDFPKIWKQAKITLSKQSYVQHRLPAHFNFAGLMKDLRKNCYGLLEDFSKYSGFRINNDKTEIFAIGSFKLAQRDFIHNVRTSIQILGTFFDYHKLSRNKANFESIFKPIHRTLNMWKCRGLTLLGKIQIVKIFIIPKFLSKAALISVSNDLIKEINKLIYGFI